MKLPTYRYRIRGWSEVETEWAVRILHGRLPAHVTITNLRPAIDTAAAEYAQAWAYSPPDPIRGPWNPHRNWLGGAFKCWRHLVRVGAVERVAHGRYLKRELPEDPLAVPSPKACVGLAKLMLQAGATDGGSLATWQLIDAARK